MSSKTVIIVFLSSLLVIIGLFNLNHRATHVEPWDGVIWEETAQGLLAAEVETESPGDKAGIRPGEILVAVNGKKVANLGQLVILLDQLGVNAGVTYRMETSGGLGSRNSVLTVEPTGSLSPRDAIRVILAFLYLAIGLFVAVRSGESPRAFHFALICLATFVSCLYHAIGSFEGIDAIVYVLSVAAPLLIPAMFVHFCMRFPVELEEGRSRAPLLYIPAVVLGLIHALVAAKRLADLGLPTTLHTEEVLDRIDLVYFCCGILIGGLILWRRQVHACDLTTRQQMKWVSSGTLAGILPFIIFYVIPVLMGFRPNFAMDLAMVFLGIVPLSFAYAIIHYRLLDVEVIVRRGAAYFMASSLLLAVYLFFVLVLGRAIEWIAPEADFIVICVAALAIALLFAPLRNTIQARLDRFFYKEQFDDRASLLDFARTLSTEISLGRLARTILERVSKTFQIDKAALLLADPINPDSFRLTDELGLDLPALDDPLVFRSEELLHESILNHRSRTAESNHLHRAHPSLSRYGLDYMQDLKLRGRQIGMIGLGPLPLDKHFSTEDLDLLAALSGYAAIALENALLYRSIEIKALELERLKIYTENILESINVAVLVLDLSGKVTSCNRAFEKLFHARRDHIQGKSIEGLFATDVISSIQRVTGTRGWELKTTSNLFKLYLENFKRESKIVNLSLLPMFDGMDQVTGSVIVMDDISLKVRLEDQLLQAEKLSSIGLLAAGFAHEVNTPITGISSYAQLLLKDTPESDHRRPMLEKIEKQTFRASEIVNGLLNFSRMNGSEYKDIDVNQLIRESLSLLEHQLRKGHINVQHHLDMSVPRVHGNGGKLQQVFINLFLNARDAMPSGGNLEIKTAMNNSTVLVDIRDTGVGISQENIKRIYDPFFTTKGSTGRGTGLGLAVTYGIIQEHGGRIFVDSSPGKGAHFRLKLPTRSAA